MRLKALQTGATIGLVAPASYAMDERVERGIAALTASGYKVRLGTHTRIRGPLYFSATSEERLADLHAAFADDSIDAIMALRGGYGSNYLLDGLDLDLIAAHPKPFFAYSDLTGVQLYLLDKLGLPAFHGPMAAADFFLEGGIDHASFQAALSGTPYSIGAAEGLRVLRTGTARGILYGGCLSILTALLGTPFEPKTEGKLLFLEDVAEKPYRIDRMLWQMRQAGKFAGVTGIIFGEMLGCEAPDNLLEEAIGNALAGLEIPLAIGLRSGHVTRSNVTLTFGADAKLTVTDHAHLTLQKTMIEA